MIFRQGRLVQPMVGAGSEAHWFFINDGPTARQLLVFYAEDGCGFAMTPKLAVGAGVGLDLSLRGEIGPGLQTRTYATWRF